MKKSVPEHLKDCGFEERIKSTFTAMKGVVEVKECPDGYSVSFYCSKTDRLVSMFCYFDNVEVDENAFAG